MVVGTAAVLTFTLMGGEQAVGGEVFLQSASGAGPDPFTPSTTTEAAEGNDSAGPVTASQAAATPRQTVQATRALEVDGAHPGLYGGTRNVASCDVERQIGYLTKHPDKGRAFAAPLNIEESAVPAYLRSLTPVRLGWDTRVTNHGYRAGTPTSYQAVLQAGTAVLVDDRGVPRVRCACGNPLAPPVAVKGAQTYSGKEWTEFRYSEVVAVRPAAKPVETVTVYDKGSQGWYGRPRGDAKAEGDHDVPPPEDRAADSQGPALPAPHPEGNRQPQADPAKEKAEDGSEPDRRSDPDPGRNPAEDHTRNQDQDQDQYKKDQHPDQDQNPDPAKPPEEAPGKDPAGDPGKDPGADPAKDPAKDPGKDPAQEPGEDPGKHPGEDPAKPPEEAPGKDPAEEPAKDPGKADPAKDPAHTAPDTPAKDPARDADKHQGRDPAQSTTEQEPAGTGGQAPAKKPPQDPPREKAKDPAEPRPEEQAGDPAEAPAKPPAQEGTKDGTPLEQQGPPKPKPKPKDEGKAPGPDSPPNPEPNPAAPAPASPDPGAPNAAGKPG
ncbi:DUF6777 domain-containing protein [Streptomyces sp. NPDC086023]|uniref:DUF6777 domain-containing protein n=1 Tax=Streptomyces sp. NPDC086023 TaxID=3365746 RepID=UPI0037D5C7DE